MDRTVFGSDIVFIRLMAVIYARNKSIVEARRWYRGQIHRVGLTHRTRGESHKIWLSQPLPQP